MKIIHVCLLFLLDLGNVWNKKIILTDKTGACSMKRVDQVYEAVKHLEKLNNTSPTAEDVGAYLHLDRTSASRYLNKLVRSGKIFKIDGRPVEFSSSEKSIPKARVDEREPQNTNIKAEDNIVGSDRSLQVPMQQAKAAILYPPRGLHTLLLGETGVGKSMFAEFMYRFAVQSGMIKETATFIRFNCADYAENPQLVMAQIFGVKKGAYTGADKDKEGLLIQADGGVLFLDEVHRLSPQGQEMLFTFIDKGTFRRLGETEGIETADVQIIAATTEDPSSFLLRTFTRRIPMVITLPALRDRSFEERMALIDTFLKLEAKRIGKSVYVNKNSLISFLLYDCPNNIGQLRSDIQLACAKAFLKYKSKDENYILITQSDLPQHVKRGHMKIQDHREAIDYLLKSNEDIFRYHSDDRNALQMDVQVESEPFYEQIEERVSNLKSTGMDSRQIHEILNGDIESHFNKLFESLPNQQRKEEVAKLVDAKTLDFTELTLKRAGQMLDKSYDESILFSLALHLHGSIDRIRTGQTIFHPQLNTIRVNYPDAFMAAMDIAKEMDHVFKIQTPLDEIGYIAMFLAADPEEVLNSEEPKVGIVVLMHGPSTASSMVQVANTLLGKEHARALDMPLSMKAEDMYEVAKEEVIKANTGRGVLLMVDMGSLVNFGSLIGDETGIGVRTIDMTSTAIVIEACRKAVLGRELGEIHQACSSTLGRAVEQAPIDKTDRTDLIITACFTGEGASEKLRKIVELHIGEGSDIGVKSLNILNKKEFIKKLDKLRLEHRILAVVSTIDLKIERYPLIPAVELLTGKGTELLQSILEHEVVYKQIGGSLKNHLQLLDGEEAVERSLIALSDLEVQLGIQVKHDVKTGILLHMGFMLDRVKAGEQLRSFDNLDLYKETNKKAFDLVRQGLRSLEEAFDLSIDEHEAAYITRMLLENEADTV